MERLLPVELFKLAKNLCAQVQPMKRRGHMVPSERIQKFPTTLEHDAVDRYSFILKFCFINARQRNNMNVMSELGQCLGHAREIIGQAAIVVTLGHIFRSCKRNSQLLSR